MIGRNALRTFVLLALGCFTLGVVAVAVRSSHFIGDDYRTFFLAENHSFLDFLFLIPPDVHFIPLHRFASYLVYQTSPLNFELAIVLLAALHITAMIYLYRTLRLLSDSTSSYLLILLYGTNLYVGVLFLWWTAGIARFPYILLSIAAIYHYLRHRREGSWEHLLVSTLCFVAALGFYTKAVLIPAYLLGAELCLLGNTDRRELIRRLPVLVALISMSVLYMVLLRSIIPERMSQLNLDLGFLLAFQGHSFSVFSASLFGIVYTPESGGVHLGIGAFWAILIAVTVVKRPANALIWMVGIGLIALNHLAIAISNRTVTYGFSIANFHRYYFELVFIAVVFLCPILQSLRPDVDRSNVASPRLLPSRWEIVACSVVTILALVSFFRFTTLLDDPAYARYPRTKQFVDNLMNELADLRTDPPGDFAFVDGTVPRYVTGIAGARVASHSRFLQLFEIDARFDDQARYLYRIGEDGRLTLISDPGSRRAP